MLARFVSASLLVSALAATVLLAQFQNVDGASDGRPPEAEKILQAMHDYAAEYVSGLPNFTCEQTTDQFQAGKKGNKWKQLDSFTSKLLFAGGREQRTLELVNGKPVRPGSAHVGRRPLTTEGEFAVLLSNIFGEASQAKFAWEGWQEAGGVRCAVFSYQVAQEHSTMKLVRSDLAKATVSYHGAVFGDPQSGAIRRIDNLADDIPSEVQIQKIHTTINYAPFLIAGTSYFLPATASIEMLVPSGQVRNDLRFGNYQRFQADSTITFGSETPSDTKPGTPP